MDCTSMLYPEMHANILRESQGKPSGSEFVLSSSQLSSEGPTVSLIVCFTLHGLQVFSLHPDSSIQSEHNKLEEYIQNLN